MSLIPCCDVCYDFCIKTSYLQLVVGGLGSYLRYLCLLAYTHIVLWLGVFLWFFGGGVFVGFFSSFFCTIRCQF